MNKKVIVNADDYGLTDGVCSSINELAEIGGISNTTLMLCAKGAPDRIALYLTNEIRSMAGVHLQLSSGMPIANRSLVASLIDENDTFVDPRKQIVDEKQVEIEWRAQIELAIKLLGKRPSHIDSHHGMHRIPTLFPIYTSLASEYGVPFRGANNHLREIIKEQGLVGTRALVRNWTGKCTGFEALILEIENVANTYPDSNVIEVVSHPGYCDENLTRISSLSSARECDHNALHEIARLKIFQKNSIDIIPFSYLAQYD